jgi:glycine/D-amino acid oxidase-like deaminating enzyme
MVQICVFIIQYQTSFDLSMYDYIVVGHGLAGALLSQELLDRGKSVLVVNDQKNNSASNVAAGIYNPITGRKMNKTWMADDLFPMLIPYYSSLEKKLNASFLHDIGVYRPFFSIEQQNDWSINAKDEYGHFVESISNKRHPSLKYNDPHGGVYLKNSGYVDIKQFLTSHKKYLVNKGCYKEMVFNKSQLKINETEIIIADLKCKRLVFCLGQGQVMSPYFDWLPFKLVKGEILEVEMDSDIKTIVNRGVFLVPKGNGLFRVGATYNWREVNEETTESGKTELIDKLQSIYTGKYKIVGEAAGIRPATKDRRPFIGQHPFEKQMYVFNGFGSKGASMIPYFAKRFAENLESGVSIEKEVNISRYFSLM